MTQPIAVRVDLEVPAAYVSYTMNPSVETRDVLSDGSVAYDLDESGAIVGVEILWIDDAEIVSQAKAFANDRGLAFPHDLRGNLVS